MSILTVFLLEGLHYSYYRGPLTWNNLPSEVRSITKIDNFKNKLKRSRLENICYEKGTAVGTNKNLDYFYF